MARSTSRILLSLSRVTLAVSVARRMVAMMSRFIAQPRGIPSVWSRKTSASSPRILVDIGATVTRSRVRYSASHERSKTWCGVWGARDVVGGGGTLASHTSPRFTRQTRRPVAPSTPRSAPAPPASPDRRHKRQCTEQCAVPSRPDQNAAGIATRRIHCG